MPAITHLNFGWLHNPPLPPACCHGLMIRGETGIVLVDSGIGMHDVENPEQRIERATIDAAGFKFLPEVTAVRQLERLGITPSEVTDIVLTHCDPDHVGGLADFPDAKVHVSAEEKANLDSGNPRFAAAQFAHGPDWRTYSTDDGDVLGLPSRQVDVTPDLDVRLVPLFGHTHGHCGVAVRTGDQWMLHVGDAYYLRGELTDPEHPVGELATAAADDNERRLQSLDTLRQLTASPTDELVHFGYHDVTELPAHIPSLEDMA